MKSPKKDVSMSLEELSKEIFIAREECLSPPVPTWDVISFSNLDNLSWSVFPWFPCFRMDSAILIFDVSTDSTFSYLHISSLESVMRASGYLPLMYRK